MSVQLLFLHGWAMNGAIFDDIFARMGADFECFAPDLPGHGTRADDEPSLARCVEVTCQTMQDLDKPIVIGWSMGAAVAWQFIQKFGTQDLSGLVTIDMSPRLLPDPNWKFGLRGQSAEQILATSAKIELQWQHMTQNILRNMFARGQDPLGNTAALKERLEARDPANLRPLWDDLVSFDARDTVKTIDIPYLVCAGTRSRLYDAEVANWIANNSADAQVALFQNSGHSPHLEEPEAFCDAIRRFVAGKIGATQDNGASKIQ